MFGPVGSSKLLHFFLVGGARHAVAERVDAVLLLIDDDVHTYRQAAAQITLVRGARTRPRSRIHRRPMRTPPTHASRRQARSRRPRRQVNFALESLGITPAQALLITSDVHNSGVGLVSKVCMVYAFMLTTCSLTEDHASLRMTRGPCASRNDFTTLPPAPVGVGTRGVYLSSTSQPHPHSPRRGLRMSCAAPCRHSSPLGFTPRCARPRRPTARCTMPLYYSNTRLLDC